MSVRQTISSRQVQIIQIARRKVEQISDGWFDETYFRLALRNCGATSDAAGRFSSKTLTQSGFEKFMSAMEDLGYREPGAADDHWRRRNSFRTGLANTRQVYEIHRLAALQDRYTLAGMCLRVSNNVHQTPEQLTPTQAIKLIEALKAITERSQHAGS